MQRIKSFFILFLPLYFMACGGYVLLHKLMPGHYVFGSLMRMFTYHQTHPFSYIFIPVLSYSLLVTIFINVLKQYNGFRRIILILSFMIASMLIAAPLGGLLWVYHDIQAGFVPPTNVLIHNLIWGMGEGLTSGLFILTISIPYNILGVTTGVLATNYILKKYFE